MKTKDIPNPLYKGKKITRIKVLFCYFSGTVPLEIFVYKTGRKYIELFLGKSRRFFYSFGEDVIFFSNLVATTRISKHLHKLSLFDNDRQGKKEVFVLLGQSQADTPLKGRCLIMMNVNINTS